MNYYVVDAFTDKLFEGNPAGVCILDSWLSHETMANIAIENNLSETAFAVKENDHYGLRWFTPGGEIDLCGHATLATAYILFRFVETDQTVLSFHTKKAGHQLTVTKKDDLYEMDFPAIIPTPDHLTDTIIEALGETPDDVLRTARDVICIFNDEETVKDLTPDFQKMKQIPEGLSVYVTAKSETYDFVARAFWPKLNIDEDPVCGTMYCALVPYWREKLKQDQFVARQVSPRGGTVYCEFRGERIKLSGKAVLYLSGQLYVDEK